MLTNYTTAPNARWETRSRPMARQESGVEPLFFSDPTRSQAAHTIANPATSDNQLANLHDRGRAVDRAARRGAPRPPFGSCRAGRLVGSTGFEPVTPCV